MQDALATSHSTQDVAGRHRTIAVTSQTPVTSFSRQNLAGAPAKTGPKSLPDTYGITDVLEYARWIEMNEQVSIDDVNQTKLVQGCFQYFRDCRELLPWQPNLDTVKGI